MACQSTTTNPVSISVEASSSLHIFSVAHAAFYQQVILSFNSDMSNPVATFTGSGEGVPMTLSNGDTFITIATRNNTALYAQFNYSASGPGGPFVPAVAVCAPVVIGQAPSPVMISVTSEDHTDNDDNDTYLTIIDLNA